MSEIKKRTVTIFDELYTILSDEPEELLSQAVTYVNDNVHTLSQKAGVQDKTKVALLSALQIAIELQKSNIKLALLEEQEKRLLASMEEHSASM